MYSKAYKLESAVRTLLRFNPKCPRTLVVCFVASDTTRAKAYAELQILTACRFFYLRAAAWGSCFAGRVMERISCISLSVFFLCISWGKCGVKINEISRGDVESNNLKLLLAEAPRPHAPALGSEKSRNTFPAAAAQAKGKNNYALSSMQN
jgi:hypothetical protein